MAYTLTHPESGASIEVEKDMVANYQSQGWETKPGAKPAESE